MVAENSPQAPNLEAKSPYELRLDQCRGVSESAVREALRTGEMGFLHSFTTGSTVDGPGVRVVGWTAGCQWRCLYCHNPDTWNMMNGIPVTLERAVEGIRKYRHGLQTMRGGFTLSGGEPLMQDRFAVKLFRACKEMGVHTAIETNGYLGSRLSDEDMNYLDLVLLGIKTWDRGKHLRLTGKDITNTLELARRLAARNTPVWVRFVLVPGLTDNAVDIAQIANFAAAMGNVERVEVLPFHQLGRFKWQRLGLDYTLTDVQPPSPELLEWACEIFRAEGLQTF
jgi:pyruvate formate lyase activating enzyme